MQTMVCISPFPGERGFLAIARKAADDDAEQPDIKVVRARA